MYVYHLLSIELHALHCAISAEFPGNQHHEIGLMCPVTSHLYVKATLHGLHVDAEALHFVHSSMQENKKQAYTLCTVCALIRYCKMLYMNKIKISPYNLYLLFVHFLI